MRKILRTTALTLSLALIFGGVFAQRDGAKVEKSLLPKEISNSSKTDVMLYPGNWENATEIVLFTASPGGYVCGTNGYDDLAKAQVFKVEESYTIKGAYFWFGEKSGSGDVNFIIWAFSDEPGEEIVKKTVALDNINVGVTSFEENAFYLEFEEPIEVTSDYAIGIEFTNIGSGEIGLMSSSDGDGGGLDLAWEMWSDGDWYSIADPSSFELDIDMAIFPVIQGDDGFAVTFNVDLTGVGTDIFDPAAHKIYIAGSFPDATWNQPGTNPDLEMSLVSKSLEYVEVFKEDFESYENGDEFEESEWTTYDQDGDEYNWFVYETEGYTKVATSASWVSPSAVTPNNWLVSPAIDLTSYSGEILLEWRVFAQDPDWVEEHYKVVISTTDNAVASFPDEQIVFEETLPGDEIYERSVDLSDYAGEIIYIAFVHYNCTDWFRIDLDNIIVKAAQGGTGAIYTKTLDLPAGDYQYKYFVVKDNPSWDFSEWPGDPNRTVTVEGDMIINDVWGIPTSADEIANGKGVNIYPNPAKTDVWVEHTSRINAIRVFDVTGRMVYTSTVNGLTTTKIDLSNFNEGVYILQVVAQDGITSKKFVVKK